MGGDFRLRPIHCNPSRYTGWMREFDGPLHIEYGTGFLYSGIRLIRNSWDGLYPLDGSPPTNPLHRFMAPTEFLESAIILKSKFETNFYHFINDMIEKVSYVEKSDLDLKIPFVIEEDVFDLRFFKDALRLNIFGLRSVHIQKRGTWITVNRAYTVHPDRYYDQSHDLIPRRLGIRTKILSRKRLYISRGIMSNYARRIINEDQLIPFLIEKKFEIVDPGQYPLEQQAELFASASVIVGAHGAGLTNILFRAGAPMVLVEFIGDTKTWNHHFFEFCQHFGFEYFALLGSCGKNKNQDASFEIDINNATHAIEQALAWEEKCYINQK
jgi:capsular polysaccharide biosynthesis protein